jgi:hypothetical protein
MRKKIEERKQQKGDTAADLKDRENELHHYLELITNIASRIDNENRSLMKKNKELKQEYKAQENDREVLVKQLVMQKKENTKINEEIQFYTKVIEEKKGGDDASQLPRGSTATKAFSMSRAAQSSAAGMTRGSNRSQSNMQYGGGPS